MKTIRHYILLLSLSAVLLLSSCAKRNASAPLSLAYLPITHSLPLLAAADIAEADSAYCGVQLLKFSAWNELSDAFASGSIDGAVVLAEIALKLRENGVPLKAVALGHHDGNVVVVANDIDSVADLRGKTVAIPHRLSSHNILLQMLLRRAGVDPKEVNVTELPPPEMPAALAEKRIAAYVVAEPFGAQGVVQGIGKVLFESSEIWEHSVCCTLIFSQEAIDKRQAEVSSLLRAYAVASDSLSANADYASAVARRYLKVDERVLAKSLEWIEFSALNIESQQYDTLTHWMRDLRLIKRDVAFADFADTTLYRPCHRCINR